MQLVQSLSVELFLQSLQVVPHRHVLLTKSVPFWHIVQYEELRQVVHVVGQE